MSHTTCRWSIVLWNSITYYMSIVHSASVSHCARWCGRLQCHVVPGGLVNFSVMLCQVVQSTSVSCVPGGPVHFLSTSVSCCARWSSRLQCYVVPGGPVHCLSTSVSCYARWSCPLQCHVEPSGPFRVTWSPVVHSTSVSRCAQWSSLLQCHQQLRQYNI